MQIENFANNIDKQFYVLLSTNQINFYTCPDLLIENPYLENSSTQNQQLAFWMRPFTTHIYHFSQRQFPLQ